MKKKSASKCPICGKAVGLFRNGCTIHADGASGRCKERGAWEKRKVRLDEIKQGPIRHQELPSFLLDIIRWTYEVVGRYLKPTLEQWETGFMRDLHVDREVIFWHQTAFAFITYHLRRQLPLRSPEEEL